MTIAKYNGLIALAVGDNCTIFPGVISCYHKPDESFGSRDASTGNTLPAGLCFDAFGHVDKSIGDEKDAPKSCLGTIGLVMPKHWSEDETTREPAVKC